MSKEILKRVRGMYEHSRKSAQYREWRNQCEKAARYYEGDQWTEQEKQTLRERGQPAITINLIAPKIDALAGTEIQGRTKIAYRSRTFDEVDEQMAKGLSSLAMNVQERTDLTRKSSMAFEDCLVKGIGWLELDHEGPDITAEHVNPYEMGWDVDDETPFLTDSMYVWREKWVDLSEAKLTWPDAAAKLQRYVSQFADDEPGGMMTQSVPGDDYDTEDAKQLHYVDPKRDKVRLVEVQYKKAATKYRYISKIDNRQREVFDKSEARKNKAEDTDVSEIKGYKVLSAYFVGDILLQHLPLRTQTGNFLYIPLPYKRRSDGVFYGPVYAAIDPQDEYNKRRSKLMHLLNTNQLIITGDAHQDIRELQAMAARPDGVIHIAEGATIDIRNNLNLAQGQFQIMQQAAQEIQQAMGIYDELLGQETNATSGIAVTRRQQASVRTQGPAFDRLSWHKKAIGRSLLALMQAVLPENTTALILGEDQRELQGQITLNETYKDTDGNKYVKHDVQATEFDVYVEEIPDFNAPPEELANSIKEIVMNGQLQLLAQAPSLMKQMGIRNVDQVVKEIQAAQPAAPDATASPAQPGAAPTSIAG